MQRAEKLTKRSAIFLDRDGVLNEDHGYVFSLENLQIPADVPGALANLKRAGYLLLVITNQSGIARGYYDEFDVYSFHRVLQKRLEESGQIRIDAFYICPHHPQGIVPDLRKTCTCRKPGTKMILDAVKEFDLDLSSCFLIGDKDTDITCSENLNIPAIQIDSKGKYKKHPKAIAYVANLQESVDIILNRREKKSSSF